MKGIRIKRKIKTQEGATPHPHQTHAVRSAAFTPLHRSLHPEREYSEVFAGEHGSGINAALLNGACVELRPTQDPCLRNRNRSHHLNPTSFDDR